MGDGWFLGAGSHAERPQEVVNQDVKLLDVLSLRVQHAEHHLVPLSHALCMWWADVILDDGLPLPPADPASQEALDLKQTTLLCSTVTSSKIETYLKTKQRLAVCMLYFFDLLDFWVVVGGGRCGAGVDLFIVFKQPSDLPGKQPQERPIIATYTSQLFSLSVPACKQSAWVSRMGPVSTINTETLAWLNSLCSLGWHLCINMYSFTLVILNATYTRPACMLMRGEQAAAGVRKKKKPRLELPWTVWSCISIYFVDGKRVNCHCISWRRGNIKLCSCIFST